MSDTYRILRSTVTEDGTVRISIDTEPMLEPGPDEVVVAVEASPINPSDLGMLMVGDDPESFESLDDVLDVETAKAYSAQATGEKRLITP